FFPTEERVVLQGVNGGAGRRIAEFAGNVLISDRKETALASPYRWQDWAAPFKADSAHPKTGEGKPYGWKRQELFAKGDGKLFDFINGELLPHLHGLDIDPKTKLPNPTASRKQRVIGRIMSPVERVGVDSETNLRDVLD